MNGRRGAFARAGGRAGGRGAVLLVLLVTLGLLAIGQTVVLELWSVARHRERERNLLFAGEQYRRALASYARLTPAGASPHPAHLEELLEDRRFPRPVAHLRQLWADPFTGRADWQLVRVGGRIVGVQSRATTAVYRAPPGWAEGARPAQARDWRFVHGGMVSAR
jgi:type II secretory pathway pseudopilin PulG